MNTIQNKSCQFPFDPFGFPWGIILEMGVTFGGQ
jgi:hypothetical protein